MSTPSDPKARLNAIKVVESFIINDPDVHGRDAGKGYVSIRRTTYGVEIRVNQKTIGFVDLFPCVDGKPPRLVLDSLDRDEPMAIMYLTTEPVLAVNLGNCKRDVTHAAVFERGVVYRAVNSDPDDTDQEGSPVPAQPAPAGLPEGSTAGPAQ